MYSTTSTTMKAGIPTGGVSRWMLSRGQRKTVFKINRKKKKKNT